MAKLFASKPSDKKMKKKLWMKIAKYLFNYKGKQEKYLARASEGDSLAGAQGIKQYTVTEALDLLDGQLKVDDLLPLFPPSEKVHNMKDHLCACLSEYKMKIERLKNELDSLATNAEELRNQ